MSKNIKDGIIIDNTVYMTDEKKTGFPVFMRIIQLLAVLAGSYSAMSIYIDCLSLPVIASRFFAVLVILGSIIYVMFLYPKYDLVKLSVSIAIYLLLLRKYYSVLKNGFFIFENAIIDRVSDYYGTGSIRFKARYSTAEEDVTLLLVMVLIPMLALLAYTVVRSRWLTLSDIMLLLPVAASFAVGVTPAEANLLLYVLTMIYITRSYGTGNGRYKNQQFMLQRIHSRAALVLIVVTMLLFSIMKLAVPEEKYNNIEGIKVAKGELQDFMFNFSWEDVTDKLSDIKWIPNRNISSGGLNSGKLGNVDEVHYDESEQLKVRVPVKSISDGMYLKGYVGAVYTGDSWEGHSKETLKSYKALQKKYDSSEYQPVNITLNILDRISLLSSEGNYLNIINEDVMVAGQSFNKHKYSFSKGSIEIEYADANKNYLYVPYITDFNSLDGVNYEYDMFAAPSSKGNKYELDYYYNLSTGDEFIDILKPTETTLGRHVDFEREYRGFVHEAYTLLPEKGLDRLKEEFVRERIGSRVDTLDKAISYVKDYLHSNAQYSLAPGKLPNDKDFVEYFIYENRVGYCSHFATSAVLMLRALGYPARYAEGYAINTSDIEFGKSLSAMEVTNYYNQNKYQSNETNVEVSVKDYSAHAWVEVYIDGFGWFPVEFTPGAGIENTENLIEEVTDAGEGLIEEEEMNTPSIAPPEPTSEADEKQKPTPTDKPVNNPEDKSGAAPSGLSESNANKGISSFLLWMIIISIPILLILIYLLMLRYRRRTESTEDRSRKAIMIYRQIERLMLHGKLLPKKNCSLEDQLETAIENCIYVAKEDFETCMEHVRKARFGRNTISKQELREVQSLYSNLSTGVLEGASLIKRTYLRLILSI